MGTFVELEQKEVGGVSIITFTGELDETNVDEAFMKIYKLFSGKYVIFNLSGLTYGNSKFLGYIASFYEYVEEKDGIMIICDCQSCVFNMFDLAGILLIIPSAPSLREAMIFMERSMKTN